MNVERRTAFQRMAFRQAVHRMALRIPRALYDAIRTDAAGAITAEVYRAIKQGVALPAPLPDLMANLLAARGDVAVHRAMCAVVTCAKWMDDAEPVDDETPRTAVGGE